MRHRLIVLALLACQSLCSLPGCDLTSSFLRDDSNRVSSFYARMTSTPFQEEWWKRYGEYFLSTHGAMRARIGLTLTCSFEGAVLRDGREGDLLRALRSDLLEMATDSGATVHRPAGERPAELQAGGFEFDYSDGRMMGKVRVEIKPAGKAGEIDVTCVIHEGDH